MGVQYFCGFMGGETDQWTPYLFRNTTQVFPWVGPPGYNLTTELADDAIRYTRDLNAATPENPFFLYFVPAAPTRSTSPSRSGLINSTVSSIWDGKSCASRSSPIRSVGVIPANAQLTPWPDSLPHWNSLSGVQKRLYAREAEVFAGYAAYTDHEIGRVIRQIEDIGKLSNALVIYTSGDNGTSAEGTLAGTFNSRACEVAMEFVFGDLDDLGNPFRRNLGEEYLVEITAESGVEPRARQVLALKIVKPTGPVPLSATP